jgi:integrase
MPLNTSFFSKPLIIQDALNSSISSRHTIDGYPKSLKLYKVTNSPFWQMHVRIGNHIITKTSKTTDLNTAEERAKSFFNELIGFRYKPHDTDKRAIDDKSTKFVDIADKVINCEHQRQLFGEISESTFKNFRYRVNGCLLPMFGHRDIKEINQKDIHHLITTLSGRQLGSISVSQHLQSLKKILHYALENELIYRIPLFPKIRKQFFPRGGFTTKEYLLLTKTARKLSIISTCNPIPTHRNRAGGAFTKSQNVPKEMIWIIRFMVNGFMRPSDVIHIQHKHVEIIRQENTYLRLTLPETKRHKAQIVTLRPAVRVYEKLKKHMDVIGLASQEDYLFLPQLKNRKIVGPLLASHFNKILSESNLKTGPLGQSRSLYSLRHTAIMFRLLYGQGIDLLTLARNSRTSVQMIEQFYASNLTAEMNIQLLQSKRTIIGRN